MQQYILFEDESALDLLPLTFTRPIWDLRVGIDKIGEKWTRALGESLHFSARSYLGPHFNTYNPEEAAIWINGKFIPEPEIVRFLKQGMPEQSYLLNESGEILAVNLRPTDVQFVYSGTLKEELESRYRAMTFESTKLLALRGPADIFQLNGACIRNDFEFFAQNREGGEINDTHSIIYGKDNLFVEPGVSIRAAVLNAEDGPIYIGKNVAIQEGAMVHGTHAFCDHVTLNMGAKLRGDSTIGPHSKVGGEVANSVIQGFSNKGHEGYLGNSVLGYWCNLGADTNTSNLKNNYSNVRLWNYPDGRFRDTGTLFCGLIMGDHSKCGINTMFNTGTVVGVSANIFGSGYPRNFIPSFSWGGAAGMITYRLNKVLEVAEAVMSRRKIAVTDADREILTAVFEATAQYRRWEKPVDK